MLILRDRSLKDVYTPGMLVKWIGEFDGYGHRNDYDNLYGIVIDWRGDVCDLLIWGKIVAVSRNGLNMWSII